MGDGTELSPYLITKEKPMEEIHVDKLMNNTIQFMLTSLTKTEAHVGQLLAKTGDKPGYELSLIHI